MSLWLFQTIMITRDRRVYKNDVEVTSFPQTYATDIYVDKTSRYVVSA